MKIQKSVIALILALALALSLGGCKKAPEEPADATPSPSPSASAAPTPTPTPRPTPAVSETGEIQELSVWLDHDPGNLDPALVATAADAAMVQPLFEGLMKWAPTDQTLAQGVVRAQIAPGQAESYESHQNDDSTYTYTFTLRADARWSDGKPVTAQDFVYAWKRSLGGNLAYLLDPVLNAAQIRAGEKSLDDLGVKAVDEHTFEVIVTEVSWFMELCAHPITAPIRQDAVEKDNAYNSAWTTTAEGCVCNGPYKLSTWTSHDHITLERNETYYDAEQVTGPLKLTFGLMDNAEQAMEAYEQGSVDFTFQLPAEAEKHLGAGTVKTLPLAGTYYLVFQNQTSPFDDAQVRRAFALAVDRDALAQSAGEPGWQGAEGLVPRGISNAQGPLGDDFRTVGGSCYEGTYEERLERAKKLLSDAGYPNGKNFPTVKYLYNKGATHAAVAQALKKTWEEALGVTVELVEAPAWDQYLEARAKGEFSILAASWYADVDDPITFLDNWTTGHEANCAQYASAAYDSYIQTAATSTGVGRFDALHRAEELLLSRDAAVSPLFGYASDYALSDGVTGLFYAPTGQFFFTACTPD